MASNLGIDYLNEIPIRSSRVFVLKSTRSDGSNWRGEEGGKVNCHGAYVLENLYLIDHVRDGGRLGQLGQMVRPKKERKEMEI